MFLKKILNHINFSNVKNCLEGPLSLTLVQNYHQKFSESKQGRKSSKGEREGERDSGHIMSF